MWTHAVPLIAGLARIPLDLARIQLHYQGRWRQSLLQFGRAPGADTLVQLLHAGWQCVASALAAPFDAQRGQYAAAVQAGICPKSMLASSRVERRLDRLERLALGVLARGRQVAWPAAGGR